jgi:hypothetical protein
MVFKIFAAIVAVAGLGFAGASVSSKPNANSCCFFGSPCCEPPQACCAADSAATASDCCYPGAPCCEAGLPCCETKACCETKSCCTETVAVSTTPKKAGCCAGGTCSEAGK